MSLKSHPTLKRRAEATKPANAGYRISYANGKGAGRVARTCAYTLSPEGTSFVQPDAEASGGH
jgi:hypothetical protein